MIPGLLVDIIPNLSKIQHTAINDIIPEMYNYAGTRTAITSVRHNNFYTVNIDNGSYNWHHTLLIPQKGWIQAGDLVEIIPFNSSAVPFVVSNMEKYIGCKAHVISIDSSLGVRLDGNANGYVWHLSVLKKVKPESKNRQYPKYFTAKGTINRGGRIWT